MKGKTMFQQLPMICTECGNRKNLISSCRSRAWCTRCAGLPGFSPSSSVTSPADTGEIQDKVTQEGVIVHIATALHAAMIQPYKVSWDGLSWEVQQPYLESAVIAMEAIATLAGGQQLVPITPTTEMITACGDLPGSMQEMWTRALAAAPR